MVPSSKVHSAVFRTTSLEVDGTTEEIIVPEKTPLGNVCLSSVLTSIAVRGVQGQI
jgi:hypothetical protein